MQDVLVTPNNSAPPISIRIPRTLVRPHFREIPKSHLAAIDPDLAEVSIEYIREGLQRSGPT